LKFIEKFGVSKFNGDIRKKNDVKKWLENNNFSFIFHLAAVVSTKHSLENKQHTKNVNLKGTKNLVDAILKYKSNLKWFFFSSTSHVYKLKKTRLSENDIISPRTFYGYTKWLGEKLLENQTLNSDLNYCIGRIFSFYSNSQSKDFLYPSIKNKIKKMSNKNNIYVLNAYNVIDIQKAYSVVNIILRLFEKKAVGIINIGTGKGTQIKNFAKKFTTKKIIVKTNSKKKNTVIANIKKLNSIINL
jgi:UDP-glucose 4-epimerase